MRKNTRAPVQQKPRARDSLFWFGFEWSSMFELWTYDKKMPTRVFIIPNIRVTSLNVESRVINHGNSYRIKCFIKQPTALYIHDNHVRDDNYEYLFIYSVMNNEQERPNNFLCYNGYNNLKYQVDWWLVMFFGTSTRRPKWQFGRIHNIGRYWIVLKAADWADWPAGS